MLFYKWIGGFLLLFCSVCVGLSQIGAERARLARAKGYLALLRHIRRQIECYSLPVGDILARAEPRLLAACGWQGGRPPDFSALLSATAEGLGGEARGELSAFAERLGGGYRADQLRLCEEHIARLSALCERDTGESAKRERLWLFLPPALCGILLLALL